MFQNCFSFEPPSSKENFKICPIFYPFIVSSFRVQWPYKQWTIYSATTFLEKCRKVVREIWLEKSGSRILVREKWLTRKKGGFIP